MTTIYKNIEVDIDVHLSDFDIDEIIEHLEESGYFVSEIEENTVPQDDVYELYRDYISAVDFDKKLKQFFEKHLGQIVH